MVFVSLLHMFKHCNDMIRNGKEYRFFFFVEQCKKQNVLFYLHFLSESGSFTILHMEKKIKASDVFFVLALMTLPLPILLAEKRL